MPVTEHPWALDSAGHNLLVMPENLLRSTTSDLSLEAHPWSVICESDCASQKGWLLYGTNAWTKTRYLNTSMCWRPSSMKVNSVKTQSLSGIWMIQRCNWTNQARYWLQRAWNSYTATPAETGILPRSLEQSMLLVLQFPRMSSSKEKRKGP